MGKINVTKSSMPEFEEYCDEIRPLWESRWLTNAGEKHKELEQKLVEYLGVENVELFCNGHLALESAITSLGLTGEVITTPFTFASTTLAIIRCGLTPVFCDIDPVTCCMDADKIESLITEKTSAIIPVHVYGTICDYKAIKEIADRHGLKVIYDAAHAFGVKVDGAGAGSLGDASMFSFHATKVFHTIEGGCVTFSGDLSKSLKQMRSFGMDEYGDMTAVGMNAKMTEFSAAMGLCNLRHVDEYIEKRRRWVMQYRSCLEGVKGISLIPEQEGVQSNYAYFPVIFDEENFGETRDEVCERLAQHNIFARKYFYPLTSEFTVCRERFSINDTPIARRISDRVLTLPLYSDLDAETVDRICEIILERNT